MTRTLSARAWKVVRSRRGDEERTATSVFQRVLAVMVTCRCWLPVGIRGPGEMGFHEVRVSGPSALSSRSESAVKGGPIGPSAASREAAPLTAGTRRLRSQRYLGVIGRAGLIDRGSRPRFIALGAEHLGASPVFASGALSRAVGESQVRAGRGFATSALLTGVRGRVPDRPIAHLRCTAGSAGLVLEPRLQASARRPRLG